MEIKNTESFLDYYERLRERTRRVVLLIPPEHLEWTYRPGKFTLGDLVRHLATIERWLYAENVMGRSPAYPGCGRDLADGFEATLAFFDEMHRQSVEIFRLLSPEQLQAKILTPAGAPITCWKWLRALAEHEIHHRGQIYLYLNMLGVATPPLFGLTSEEVLEKSILKKMADQIQFTTVSTPDEVRQILDLQEKNLASSLSAETMASQGFVTVKHDPAVLQRMNEVAPAVIAKDVRPAKPFGQGDQVVGYALVMPREFAPEVPILLPMFEMLDGLSWKNKPLRDNPRWFAMGQICVAEGYRGLGVFDGLYLKMKEAYHPSYDFTVTEVAERNTRSMRAHERVGFQTLHVYPDEAAGEVWRVVVLEF